MSASLSHSHGGKEAGDTRGARTEQRPGLPVHGEALHARNSLRPPWQHGGESCCGAGGQRLDSSGTQPRHIVLCSALSLPPRLAVAH